MAGPSDPNRRSSEPDREPQDPFTAFTRFVDQQMSQVLQSVLGLPSSKEDMTTWRPWEELQKKDQHPWGWGFDEKHHHRLNDDSISRTQTPSQKPPLPPTQDHTTDGVERCSPSEALSNLSDYLNHSPYSPVHLEQNPHLPAPVPSSNPHHLDPSWRSAFWDLLAHSRPPLSSPEDLQPALDPAPSQKVPREAYTAALLREMAFQYHNSALSRDVHGLNPLALAVALRRAEEMRVDVERWDRVWEREMREFGRREGEGGQEGEEGEETEADMYDLWKSLSTSTSESPAEREQMPPALARDLTTQTDPTATAAKPSIISKLTTIERITKPDGTTETRRVLKTRFDDGTENMEESSEIVKGRVDRSGVEETRTEAERKGEDGDRKGGWFWK